MKTTGNTILITGGGSGIGRALAEAFHARGNTVIVAGRRKDFLEAAVAAKPGMHAATLDVTRADAIRDFARRIVSDFPRLNVVVNSRCGSSSGARPCRCTSSFRRTYRAN